MPDSPRSPLVWICLFAVLAVGGPLFVAMPPTADASMYDVQARIVQSGGVLYRDAVEPNLPGVVWVHAAIRPWIGPSSEALRLFDLAVFATIVLLLVPRTSAPHPPRSVWVAVWLFVAYFSFSEWCHCQRDTWMLLPAAAAMHRRLRQWGRLNGESSAARGMLFAGGLLEGTLWAAAFWLKPHVAVPAMVCLAVTWSTALSWRRVAVDAVGVLTGGLLVGAAGVAWLVGTGAWPWFWEMLVEWNPEYLAVGRSRWTWTRIAAMIDRMQPWMLLHLFAVPVAVRAIVVGRREAPRMPVVVAAAYLGWLAQAALLQHAFDYVQAPPVLLAIVVLGSLRLPAETRTAARCVVAGFAMLVVLASPLFRVDRLAVWPRAITEGSTPEVRDALGIVRFVGWREMDDVRRYLDEAAPDGRGVVCYSGHLVHLYGESGFVPPTRYVYLQPSIRCFPSRRSSIRETLRDGRPRYVVTSMVESGLPLADALAKPASADPPPAYDDVPHSFPWQYPVVFRSGRYLVHRVDGPPGELGVELLPLDRPAQSLVADSSTDR